MNCKLTTTLSVDVYDFLNLESQRLNVSKKKIIETALDLYRKQKLKQSIEFGLRERQAEYGDIALEFKDANNDLLIDII